MEKHAPIVAQILVIATLKPPHNRRPQRQVGSSAIRTRLRSRSARMEKNAPIVAQILVIATVKPPHNRRPQRQVGSFVATAERYARRTSSASEATTRGVVKRMRSAVIPARSAPRRSRFVLVSTKAG